LKKKESVEGNTHVGIKAWPLSRMLVVKSLSATLIKLTGNTSIYSVVPEGCEVPSSPNNNVKSVFYSSKMHFFGALKYRPSRRTKGGGAFALSSAPQN